MADLLSATLELRDKFSATIKKAGTEFTKLEGNFGKMQSKMKTFEKSLLAGGAIGGFAAGTFLKSAFTGYADLEDQIARNRAISGASIEDSKIMRDQVIALGKATRFTAKEVAMAQQYQAMAGYDVNQILEMTPKLLKLSVASGEDLARTSDIVTDNLDAFGLEMKDVDRFLDVMSATANNTNTNIGMLGEAFQHVAATSKNFDSFEEVSIMLGILANNGIKAGKAGRNLAGIYNRLSKRTPEMNKQLAKTNTVLYDEQGKFLGLRTIIEEAKPALEKLTEEQRNQWLATVVGAEGLKVWNSLMNYSAEGTKKVEKAVRESNGATEKAYEIMKETPKQKIKELESAFDNLKLAIADGMAPAVTEAMEGLTKKLMDLTDSDAFKKENMESFFNSMFKNIELAVKAYAGLKIAILAANHPYLTAAAVSAMAGGYVGKKAGSGLANGLHRNEIRQDIMKRELEGRDIYKNPFSKEDYARIEKEVDEQMAFDDDFIKNGYKFNPKDSGPKSNYNGIMKLNNPGEDLMKNINNPIPGARPDYGNLSGLPGINIDLGGVTINKETDIDTITSKVSVKLGQELKNQYSVQQ